LRRLQICEQQADFSADPAARIAFAKQAFRHPVGPVFEPSAIAAA
jgi:hypothetical protein